MRQTGWILLLFLGAWQLSAQSKAGNKWVDNNLVLRITDDDIRQNGKFFFCIADTSRGPCIANLHTGVEVKVYDAQEQLLWEGIATGRTTGLKLPEPMPQAVWLEMQAFKPWVVNRSTGTHIHQDKKLYIKHKIEP